MTTPMSLNAEAREYPPLPGSSGSSFIRRAAIAISRGSPGTDKGWAWDAREWAIEPGDEGGDVLPFDDEQPAAPSSSGASRDSATAAAELHGADLLMCCP